jgi:hypothetical protein
MRSSKCLQVIGTGSNTNLKIRRRITSIEAAKMAGRRITVQCKVQQSSGGTVTPTLSAGAPASTDTYSSIAAASRTGELSAVSMQACPNSTTTTLAYTFDLSTGATAGLEFTWDFGALTSGSLYISDFDVRVTPSFGTGLNAAPDEAEIKNYPLALLESKAYFQRLWHVGSGQYYSLCVAALVSATAAYAIVVFPTPLWAAPNVTWSSPGDFLIGAATANFTPSAASVAHITEASALITLTISGGSAQAGMCLIAYPGYIDLSAEL